jgi:predicted permease
VIWMSRLLDLVLSRRRDARLDEEIAGHMAALRADFERQGRSPADAELAARRAFGSVDQVKAHVRDTRGWPWLDAVTQDVRFAVRHLSRDRAFSVPLIAVLALGIGVSHMFFTLTYGTTMRGLPMPDVDRVHAVWTVTSSGSEGGLSFPEFEQLREATGAFERLAAYATAPVTLGDRDRAPDRFDGVFATAAAFDVARVTAVTGRVLSDEDDSPSAPLAVVLTERASHARYGSDSSVVGRDVRVNGVAATIVGVVKDKSGFPSTAAVFVPLKAMPGLQTAKRDARSLRVFARLADRRTSIDATNELTSAAASFASAFPADTVGVRFLTAPINTRFFGGRVQGWLPFITAGLIVVAVASLNAGNLLLAGARARAREVAIRASMGAARWRIARQLLVESVVVAGIAGLLGFALSRAGVGFYRSRIPDGAFPYWFDYTVDSTVFAALWAMTCATLVVFAVGPAFAASRTSVVTVLKDGGRADTGLRGSRMGGTLFLAVQVGLALVLVAQVGTAALTPGERLSTDGLLEDRQVATASVTLPQTPYGSPERRREIQRQFVDRLRTSGAVAGVALASGIPLDSSPELPLSVEGRPDTPDRPRVFSLNVSADYFAVLDVGVTRGRAFTSRDGVDGDPVVIVNERLVSLHFADADPIGRRIALTATGDTAPSAWATVVGVVPDIRHRPGHPAAVPIVYAPLTSSAPATFALLVRGTTDVAAVTSDIRATLRTLDADVPLYRTRSLAAAAHEAGWLNRMSATLANTVCLSTFVLAVFGLFAVVSHRTLLRRREIGLRMAMGGHGSHIASLVVGSVAGALAAGLVLGMLGVVAWERAFAPPAGVYALRVPSILAVVVGLIATVLLGCAWPTWRTARMTPADALRRE